MLNIDNPVALAVLGIATVAFIIQAGFYWLSFSKLAFGKQQSGNTIANPVSVVICAKNELKRLQKYLTAILEQAYHDYEVIVVDDCSWDSSGEYLEQMAAQYSRLKVVTIKEQERYRHGKKFALTLGIKAAKNDVLLLTDADCIPASRNWITHMQQQFNPSTDIVLGYGAYRKEAGLLNRLIRFDAFIIGLQYLSAAFKGRGYMGVGRNLAYRKSLFFKVKGFASHNHLLSGDDDLFVNQTSDKTNTRVCIHPESFTVSEPKKTWKDWFRQKIRHQSTARHYKGADQFRLGMYWTSGLFFYVSLFVLLCLNVDWRIVLSLYGLLLLIKFPVIYKSAARLNEKDLRLVYPILEFMHFFIQPVFFIINQFTKQKTWK